LIRAWLVLALYGVSTFGQSSPTNLQIRENRTSDDDTVRAQITSLNQQLNDAAVKGDLTFFGKTMAPGYVGVAQSNSSAESGATAKAEAEIRHEQKYVERETPSDRQFSTVNSETPGTEGKIGNCDPKRRGSSEYRACDLTFLRKARRESHRVMRPGVFPPTYFSGVHNDWGLWEESKDGRLRYFTLHADGRVEIGAARSMPHSVH